MLEWYEEASMDRRDLARFFLPWLFLTGVALGAGCAGETTEGGTGGGGGVPGGSAGAGSGGRASGGASAVDGGAVDAGSPSACGVQTDCAWGEIDHEILGRADCPCLYGCPYLPLNRSTVERRRQQYDQLCDPNVDGQGRACGIDDCFMPPPLLCILGQCMGAP